MIDFFYDSCIVVLKFIIPGVFLGVVYDVFRLFRISRNDHVYSVRNAIKKRFSKQSGFEDEKTKKQIPEFIVVLIEDISFFIIVAITEILAVFHFNDGEIRICYLISSAVGFFVYQKTLGNLVIFFSKKMLYLIRKFIYLIACLILTPAFFFFRQVKKIFFMISMKRKNRTTND